MISKSEYEFIVQYKEILDLFARTGEYVGGADALFDHKKIADKGCATCKAQCLIETHAELRHYENNQP